MSQPIQRRTFLKATGSAMAAGALAATVGAAASSARAADDPAAPAPAPAPGANRGIIFKSLKIGMVKLNGSLEDKFKVLKDLGYDGVEWNSPGAGDVKGARDASEKVGLPIHGVVDSTHWGVRHSSPDAAVRARALEDLKTAIRDSNALGGNSVLLVAGHGQDGTQEEVSQRAVANIRQALPLAAKLGQRILIENVWNSFTYQHDGPDNQSADLLRDFIDAIGSPWVGSYFDIGNHHKYGQPEDWARTLGHRVIKLDIKGYSRKANNWSDIGEGTINWPAVCAALREFNFTGWATAEIGGGDAKRLKTIAEQMDRVLEL